MPHRPVRWLLGAAAALAPFAVAAQVATDGSLGAKVTLDGLDVEVGADLGTRRGQNLFHSFGRFNIGTGGRVTFSGPAGLDSIISRVTGGERSTIDGTLRSIVPGADLYLLNPSGILFGPNARLDVPAAFHAGTAHELRFADGARLRTGEPTTSGLTVAAPEAFGFLGVQRAAVVVDRSLLEVRPGERLSLVGGDVASIAGTILADAGHVGLDALGGPGTVPIDGGEATGDLSADVLLTAESLVAASGDGGGSVRIRGGNIIVEQGSQVLATNLGGRDATAGVEVRADTVAIDGGSVLAADAQGTGAAGPVTIEAREVDLREDSVVSSGTFGAGRGGRVEIRADRLLVGTFGLVTSSAEPGSSGPAGAVGVTAGLVELRAGGVIRSSSFGTGDAGRLRVDAGTLRASGDGVAGFTGISSQASPGAGDAATVEILAEAVELLRNASIRSITFGDGSAGKVILTADRLLVSDASIASQTSRDATGVAAMVEISADSIELRDLAQISASTFGAGDGGAVRVDAGRLLVTLASLASQSNGGTGAAGSVTVATDELEIRRGGIVGSGTFGPGNGGSVAVEAGRLLVSGDGVPFLTGISSQVNGVLATGDAGPVSVTADAIEMRDGGAIGSDTFGIGSGGTVRVDAGRIRLSGDRTAISSQANPGAAGDAGAVAVTAGDLRLEDGATLSTGTFGLGKGGTVRVAADEIALSRGGLIASGTQGDGAAGSVVVDAGRMRVDGGGVLAVTGVTSQSNLGAGDAGQITLVVDDLELRAGGLISSNTFARGSGGRVSVAADRVLVTGAGSPLATGITSLTGGLGDAGDGGAVTVEAKRLAIRDRGLVSSESLGTGDAGQVDVRAGHLELHAGGAISSAARGAGDAGRLSVVATDRVILDDATISTEAAAGGGGRIELGAGGLLHLVDDSLIATSVFGGADTRAGDIDIDQHLVVLNRASAIRANATVGSGGAIRIRARRLVVSAESLIDASAGPAGIDGTVVTSSPEVDLTSGLVVLPTAFLGVDRLLQASCDARATERVSSFTAAGRGGLPAGPEQPLAAGYAPVAGAGSPLAAAPAGC